MGPGLMPCSQEVQGRVASWVSCLLPPGPMGCISLFIWTFQCLTLVLACRSFRWAAWQGWREGVSWCPTAPDWDCGHGFPFPE